jgi:hypothetical protein
MPKLRPLAALVAASILAACAAGDHRVPDEGDRIDVAHRDSLATGSAIPATLPFAGTVYPVPPSHHARGASPQAPPASPAPLPDGAALDTAAVPVVQEPATGATPPPAQPSPPAAPPAAPAVPPADEAGDDEHAGHTP